MRNPGFSSFGISSKLSRVLAGHGITSVTGRAEGARPEAGLAQTARSSARPDGEGRCGAAGGEGYAQGQGLLTPAATVMPHVPPKGIIKST